MSTMVEAVSVSEEAQGAPPTVSFRIRRDDFIGVLRDVAPFAGGDSTLPMLNAVFLSVAADGVVIAEATDRFTAGRRTFHLPVDLVDTAFAFTAETLVQLLLPLHDVTRLDRIHVGGPRGAAPRMLSVEIVGTVGRDRGSITVESGGADAARVRSIHTALGVEFVSLQRMFDAAKPVEAARVSVDPERLAKFARVKRGREVAMRVEPCGPRNPIRITIGEQFVGLLMPMRDES